jgi:hypothetical protein
MSNFLEIRPKGTDLFHADEQTGRHDESFFGILRKSIKYCK